MRHWSHGRDIYATIRQLVSMAITTEGQVIDVFTAAGLQKPDISILSDQFLAEVRGLKHKNVAAELLEKLLRDETKVRAKRNLVQSELFSEKLKKALNRSLLHFHRGAPDAGLRILLLNGQN